MGDAGQVYRSVPLLFLSRAVVGLAKQSATLSKHILSQSNDPYGTIKQVRVGSWFRQLIYTYDSPPCG